MSGLSPVPGYKPYKLKHKKERSGSDSDSADELFGPEDSLDIDMGTYGKQLKLPKQVKKAAELEKQREEMRENIKKKQQDFWKKKWAENENKDQEDAYKFDENGQARKVESEAQRLAREAQGRAQAKATGDRNERLRLLQEELKKKQEKLNNKHRPAAPPPLAVPNPAQAQYGYGAAAGHYGHPYAQMGHPYAQMGYGMYGMPGTMPYGYMPGTTPYGMPGIPPVTHNTPNRVPMMGVPYRAPPIKDPGVTEITEDDAILLGAGTVRPLFGGSDSEDEEKKPF